MILSSRAASFDGKIFSSLRSENKLNHYQNNLKCSESGYMCPSGATCLSVTCYFSELAL
jgi:hypothetical protein